MFILKSKHDAEVKSLTAECGALAREARLAKGCAESTKEAADRSVKHMRRELEEIRRTQKVDRFELERLALASSLALAGLPADHALEQATVIYPVPK